MEHFEQSQQRLWKEESTNTLSSPSEDSSNSLFLSLSSLTHTYTHTLLHTISLSLSLLLTHKHSYTHSLTHPAYVSLSHTLYLTHTLTHVLFLSFDVRNGEVSDSSTLNLIDYDVHHKALSVQCFAHSAAIRQWLSAAVPRCL